LTAPPFTDGAADRFSELFGRFWDSTVPEAETARQVALIEACLGLRPPSRLLVVPSGCGRIALGLGRRGHQVLGVETCPDAAGRSAGLAARAGLSVAFVSEAPPAGRGGWDAAICVGLRRPAAEYGDALALVLAPGAQALVEADGAARAYTVQAFERAGFDLVGEHPGIDSATRPTLALRLR